ncbi:MAG: phosphopyruvate hydratase [Candidatus Levybacteria bacterium]|nr:phosphopyruvate hydratase [Candidatus Levybacteria bacterium]
MAKIKQVIAYEILDSRGNPTIETTVVLHDGSMGTASVPSGASTSSYEVAELRDKDEGRYKGMGVQKAIENINKILGPGLSGAEASHQQHIDKMMIELDGTQNKSRLGGNAILSVSMAIAKAAAKSAVLPLYLYLRQFINRENVTLRVPTPLFNILNGGQHAGRNVDFQEFIVTPATSKSFSEGLLTGSNIYNSLKEVMREKNYTTLTGDEGGFAPPLSSNLDALALIKDAIARTSSHLGFDIFMGIDIAANSFYQNQNYHLSDHSSQLSPKNLAEFYASLLATYPLLYLEDPFAEDDWEGWEEFAKVSHKDLMVVGDDLVSTNPFRLQMALDKNIISGVIIKPNQIGTVIEAMAVVEVARAAGLKTIVSHRSGETNDDFIADFAVAVSSDYVKFGAPAHGERVAKYNRLLHIEKQLKSLESQGNVLGE